MTASTAGNYWDDGSGIPYSKDYDADFQWAIQQLHNFVAICAREQKNPMSIKRALVVIHELVDINILYDRMTSDETLAVFEKQMKEEARGFWKFHNFPGQDKVSWSLSERDSNQGQGQ